MDTFNNGKSVWAPTGDLPGKWVKLSHGSSSASEQHAVCSASHPPWSNSKNQNGVRALCCTPSDPGEMWLPVKNRDKWATVSTAGIETYKHKYGGLA